MYSDADGVTIDGRVQTLKVGKNITGNQPVPAPPENAAYFRVYIYAGELGKTQGQGAIIQNIMVAWGNPNNLYYHPTPAEIKSSGMDTILAHLSYQILTKNTYQNGYGVAYRSGATYNEVLLEDENTEADIIVPILADKTKVGTIQGFVNTNYGQHKSNKLNVTYTGEEL